jgi:hypothetical protein
MKLWETYFRLWQRFSDSLTEGTTQLQLKEKSLSDDESVNTYYGYLCDKGECVVSGV